MSQFIIEMGSGNTCRNDIGKVREMIDAVVDADTGQHEIVFKWQLFHFAPPNEPLLWCTFAYAYGYAAAFGYDTTASVFDFDSANFLASFDTPFIKIANQPRLWRLARQIDGLKYISVNGQLPRDIEEAVYMHCVSEYPADAAEYQATTQIGHSTVSDHTIGWDLYWDWRPSIIEKHFVLEHDASNPDGGPFAVTPKQLAEVL